VRVPQRTYGDATEKERVEFFVVFGKTGEGYVEKQTMFRAPAKGRIHPLAAVVAARDKARAGLDRRATLTDTNAPRILADQQVSCAKPLQTAMPEEGLEAPTRGL